MLIASEELISLQEAATALRSYNSLWRAAREGVKARDGSIIRLEVQRIGGRLYTTAEAIERFDQKVNQADLAYFENRQNEKKPIASPSRQATRRDRDVARAEAELESQGI